ncbi:MAG: GNAT family N-acetyltransferase [Ilumatobacteraceae bacterium]
MTVLFNLKSLGQCRQHWNTAAEWSWTAWAREFPGDTVQTYLQQYDDVSRSTTGMPDVVAAISPDDELLGIATLVLDDELPGADEPGPWLAAVYVTTPARRIGVGQAITMWIAARAQMLGFSALHLYTEDKREWYEGLGWRYCRMSAINHLPVAVMELRLSTDANRIFHLTTRQVWDLRPSDYTHPSLETEGFIHCSTLHQLTSVANKYYLNTSEVIVLVIDPERLTSHVRWEAPRYPDGTPAEPVHLLYPHIYGEINSDAVIDIVDMARDTSGRYRLPARMLGHTKLI